MIETISSFLGQSLLFDSQNVFKILLILMVLIWTSGRIFHYFRLPAVLGEIIAGALLGPSILGVISPDNEAIKVLSELGVFFLMFHAGLDTDPREIRGRVLVSITSAVGGIFLIFCGTLLFSFLFKIPTLSALFLATVLSVNSIPVILSMLKDVKLHTSHVGHIAIASSLSNEILLFVIFSVLISIADAGGVFQPMMLLFVAVKVLVFFLGTLFMGIKILPFFSRFFKLGMKGFTLAMIIALFFGLFAETIGLSIVLGAYLGGMFLREEIEDEVLFKKIEDRFFGIAYSFLGPIFFASVGMAISFQAIIQTPLLLFGLFLVVFIGQIIGSALPVYFSKILSFRDSLRMGTSLLGRGGTELIVAQIGFQTMIHFADGTKERLLSATLFSDVVLLVLMLTFAMPFVLKYLNSPIKR